MSTCFLSSLIKICSAVSESYEMGKFHDPNDYTSLKILNLAFEKNVTSVTMVSNTPLQYM